MRCDCAAICFNLTLHTAHMFRWWMCVSWGDWRQCSAYSPVVILPLVPTISQQWAQCWPHALTEYEAFFMLPFWGNSTISVRCELNSKQSCSTWAHVACSHAWRDGCFCWAAGQRWTSATDTPSDPQPCSLSLITFPEWGRWIWCVSPQTRAAAQGAVGE